MASPGTILLIAHDQESYDEARASVLCSPGHLIEHAADGTVKPHATAGGDANLNFAIESVFTAGGVPGGTFVSGGIDTDYAIADLVRFHRAMPGDVIYAWLATANNADPSKWLASNGDGTFKVANGTTDRNLVKPAESLNNTSGAKQRIRVRVPAH